MTAAIFSSSEIIVIPPFYKEHDTTVQFAEKIAFQKNMYVEIVEILYIQASHGIGKI